MSQTGLAAFNSTVQTTHRWINDMAERLGWADQRRAYLPLRAVLHALLVRGRPGGSLPRIAQTGVPSAPDD
jgi:hypothetical protein